MNLFEYFRCELMLIVNQLVDEGDLPENLETNRISVDPPRDLSHGDITTNAALILAKKVGVTPFDLAKLITKKLIKNKAY